MVPILFDTDIGSDIDDAVALAYLLKQPDCELVGITTVSGDTAKRAALAEIVCRAGGREDIPIHAGLAGPLLHGPGQPNVPQFEAIADQPHRKDYGNTALKFLRDAIRARPGEITLLAVGPLTNIAVLFAADPELPSLLKRIVLMCGVFLRHYDEGPIRREWNAFVDPVATAMVFQQGAGRLLSVGLDVTTRCTMPADESRTRFVDAGGALAVVGKLAEVWFKHAKVVTFHDPLAAALIFEPEISGYATGTVSVVVDPGPREGFTEWEPSESGPHTVATTVDSERFFANYFGIVNR